MIQKLQEENRHLQQKLDEVSQQLMVVLQRKKLILSWKMCKVAPCTARSGSATVSGSIAYFRLAGSKQVMSYDPDTEKMVYPSRMLYRALHPHSCQWAFDSCWGLAVW